MSGKKTTALPIARPVPVSRVRPPRQRPRRAASTAACSACITDRAAIEAAFASDFESEAQQALTADLARFIPTTPDDGDEGSTPD